MCRSLLYEKKIVVTVPSNELWALQARKLAWIMQPIVTWVRDNKGTRLEESALSGIVSLASLEGVIGVRSLSVRGVDDVERAVDLTGMPEDVFASIRSYLEGVMYFGEAWR